ncbi:MAG: hypothetical protein ABJ205_10605 [Erythrobacter sp.]|uniref:hypothetical protein n=1 Tax=Erythrobacter sp. TaxID=1042 RepID=UPI003263C25A
MAINVPTSVVISAALVLGACGSPNEPSELGGSDYPVTEEPAVEEVVEVPRKESALPSGVTVESFRP